MAFRVDGQVVRGAVRDSAGAALDEATVTIDGTTLRATTGTDGRFVLRDVPAGSAMLRVRAIGFYPDSVRVRVADLVTVDVMLRAAPVQLAPELITDDPAHGKMGPFNERRVRGVGSFITRAEIEKRQPGSISEMLRYLPGVAVSQRMAGEPQPVQMQRSVNTTTTGNCVVQIYVDGHPYPNGNVDDFAPLSVEGIEVYRSAAEIPGAFRTKDATCGVIAIWTRDPDARKP